MKVKTLAAIVAFGCTLIMNASASAVFVGLSATSQVGPSARRVWRIYAHFIDPNDYLTIVYGDSHSPLTIQSTDIYGGPGSNFFNPITSHANSPSLLELNGGTDEDGNPIPPVPGAAYDTFVTIGISNQGQANPAPNPGTADATSSLGIPANFISGTSFATNNGAWYTPGPVEQGRAGYAGDGDPQLRVLMMQLTVSSTSFLRGTLNIAGVNNTPLAGGQSFAYEGLTFHTYPSTGPLPLLFIAGLVGSRRRR